MTPESIERHLEQFEAQALMLAQSIRSFRALLQEGAVIEPSVDCAHPADMRLNAPTMGRPGRFYCRKCKKNFEVNA